VSTLTLAARKPRRYWSIYKRQASGTPNETVGAHLDRDSAGRH
jgi:hypothetical protein